MKCSFSKLPCDIKLLRDLEEAESLLSRVFYSSNTTSTEQVHFLSVCSYSVVKRLWNIGEKRAPPLTPGTCLLTLETPSIKHSNENL